MRRASAYETKEVNDEDQIPDDLKTEVDEIIEGIKAGNIDTGW